MRPNATPTLYRNDSVDETITMRVDANSLQHIMAVLTDLYSDAIMAVIREYCTNAWDSHLAAGNTGPIWVTLPSYGSRKFIVQDFGIGMSVDDLREIYSAYGNSTKRDSDDATGMLGLGCKSALTYTNSFTIDAVKGGVRTIASVTKSELSVGEIRILDTSATDAPNGVTITIPVAEHDLTSFEMKAKQFFPYWRGGVLVDGAEITQIEGAYTIDPDVMLLAGNRRVIVMGNVPYPVPGNYHDQGWIAWVEMGAVNFTPSREALHMTSLTLDTIAEVDTFVKARTPIVINDAMGGAATEWDKVLKYEELKGAGVRGGIFKYLKPITAPDDRKIWRANKDGTSNSLHNLSAGDLVEHVTKHHIITNFPFKRVSPVHSARLHAHLGGNQFVLIPDGTPGLHEYHGMPTTNWNDIPELAKEEREKVVAERTKATYPVLIRPRVGGSSYWGTSDVLEDELDTEKEIIYWDSDQYLKDYAEFAHEAQLVVVHTRRQAKFKRLYPDAKPMEDLLRERCTELVAELTADDVAFVSIDRADFDWAESSTVKDGFLDPEITALLVAVQRHKEPSSALRKLVKLGGHRDDDAGLNPKILQYIRTGGALSRGGETIVSRYPLLSHVRSYYSDSGLGQASREYMNLYYTAHLAK